VDGRRTKGILTGLMSLFSEKRILFLTCAKGLGPYLVRELGELGFVGREIGVAGVETEGDGFDAMRLNMHLRTAQRVYYHLDDFEAEDADQLYKRVVAMPWEDLLLPDGYFTVHTSVFNDTIRDTRFAGLRCKDAIVDRMRQCFDRRPDTGSEQRGAAVYLYWHGQRARIFIDTSGEPLSRRGYRKIPQSAPLQETLAATILMASGWDPNSHLVIPMCGSGTLAIEGALMAMDKAPGLLRIGFAFQHLVGFDPAVLKELRSKLRTAAAKAPSGKIIATDIRREAVDAARQNAKTAGVDHLIEFETCDYKHTRIPEGPGAVILNPGYGERLGVTEELRDLYKGIGDFFKQQCQGYSGHIFTGNPELAKCIGLRTRSKTALFNGAIECRLLSYDLYSGTRKSYADVVAKPEP